MRKLILLAGAVVLLVAAPAPASTSKTVTVDISKAGFVPGNVTIQAGDVISWTNKDTANHQVVCATCPYTSPVLAPNANASFVFTKVGKFNVVDPLNNNKKATVTVNAAPATLTVAAAPRTVNYGGSTTVSGTLSTAQANQKVDIMAQPCGENNAKAVGTVTTGAGGAFTFHAQPTLNTIYSAKFGAGNNAATSPNVNVNVRPIVKLRRNAAHRFSVQVISAQSFVGKAVVFQRWVAKRKRWIRVKTVFLGARTAASTPLAATTVSTVTFGANLRSRLSVRAVLASGQAGPCYVTAKSATIRS
jgi:plastocyanin